MREVDGRLKKSAKGNEAAKSKTTRNYDKCGESFRQRLSGNALLPFTGRVVATRKLSRCRLLVNGLPEKWTTEVQFRQSNVMKAT